MFSDSAVKFSIKDTAQHWKITKKKGQIKNKSNFLIQVTDNKAKF